MNIFKKKRHPIKKTFFFALILLIVAVIYKNPLDQIYNGKQPEKEEATPIQQQYRREQLTRAQQLDKEGKSQDAIHIYQELLYPDKKIADLHVEIGKTYIHLKQYDDALRHMYTALEINPSLVMPHLYIGKEWRRKGDLDKAIFHYFETLKQEPDNIIAHLQLGLAFMEQQEYEKSIKHNLIALKLNPSNIHALLTIGHVYNKIGQLDKAILMYQRTIKLEPELANAHYNLGVTLKYQGKFEQALASLDTALALQPNYPDAHLAKAQIYWAMGDYEKAQIEYRWRWKTLGLDHIAEEKEMWNGKDDLNGKTILLYCEQGLGDTIQFVRYAKLAKEMGATVICKIQKPLIPLLSSCPFIDKLVTSFDEAPYEYKAALMSMPGIVKTKEETIPAEIPYISASENLVSLWKQRISRDKGFKVGLCWEVEQTHEQFKCPFSLRSISLEHFAPLATVEGVQFYSLQKLNSMKQCEGKPEHLKLKTFGLDFDETHGSFMDTAAIIENLDLIITVDTSVAHVAGSLGKPVWMLLPYSPDCRWGINRSDTPWYPTMKLFRQKEPGNVADVLHQVADELTQEIAKKQFNTVDIYA